MDSYVNRNLSRKPYSCRGVARLLTSLLLRLSSEFPPLSLMLLQGGLVVHRDAMAEHDGVVVSTVKC